MKVVIVLHKSNGVDRYADAAIRVDGEWLVIEHPGTTYLDPTFILAVYPRPDIIRAYVRRDG